jgi:hypothetical protein
MRLLIGAGTPREAAGRPLTYLLFVYIDRAVTIILVAAPLTGLRYWFWPLSPTPADQCGTSATDR